MSDLTRRLAALYPGALVGEGPDGVLIDRGDGHASLHTVEEAEALARGVTLPPPPTPDPTARWASELGGAECSGGVCDTL